MRIVSKMDGTTQAGGYRLTWTSFSPGERFDWTMKNASTTTVSSVGTATGTAVDTWNYVCAWHNASQSKSYIQLNNGTPVSAADTGTPSTNTEPFEIGAQDGTNHFDGRIDQVEVVKRVLTDAERTWRWNGGNGRAYSEY
jgi:hypothetical protein